mmetsp:Transcript_21270/g.72040  ORF Transcript_21270/g.72040 Transcript_21270/m.72040 type:complete len:208 (-) Transcript_21270:1174-1797(-)
MGAAAAVVRELEPDAAAGARRRALPSARRLSVALFRCQHALPGHGRAVRFTIRYGRRRDRRPVRRGPHRRRSHGEVHRRRRCHDAHPIARGADSEDGGQARGPRRAPRRGRPSRGGARASGAVAFAAARRRRGRRARPERPAPRRRRRRRPRRRRRASMRLAEPRGGRRKSNGGPRPPRAPPRGRRLGSRGRAGRIGALGRALYVVG